MSRWRHRFVVRPVSGLGVREVTAVDARGWPRCLACVPGSAALILGLAARRHPDIRRISAQPGHRPGPRSSSFRGLVKEGAK